MTATQDTRMALAEQCRALTLTPHGEDLAEAAARLHCVGNDGSGERWDTDQSYHERALMGYRGEVAVAEHYDLTPRIDYRPPSVGDAGHDYRVRLNSEMRTIDVKTTRVDPPRLYLTRKRDWHDRYSLPDGYLLVASELTPDDRLHLVGYADAEAVKQQGTEREVYGNPVWELPGLELDRPPARDAVEPLPRTERELRAACDRAEVEYAEVVGDE